MIPALRTVRIYNPSSLVPSLLPSSSAQKPFNIRFQRAETVCTKSENMDKTHDHQQKTKEVMSDSFGEGYATRSDEEGFGGICGGSQQIPKTNQEKDGVHGNHAGMSLGVYFDVLLTANITDVIDFGFAFCGKSMTRHKEVK
ncbi:hypothetical protein NE237_023543 [Protea cynaroides]|uniref:Uncharacterized protein n=1 Tax=Protea cynaroides TaxID=273540 RepID=A0A9Q0K4J5_9MAGN|nr:hypothetical protein NE237_023543 [Protea cynaroides]